MNSCSHPNPIHTTRGNAIWLQCPDCFASVGSAVRRANFTEEQIAAMPMFNAAAREQHYSKLRDADQAEREKDREERNEAWWAKYNGYLRSPEWHAKRIKVLRRDQYRCQACLESEAVQVHHKTYQHLYDEPLFDLESVCVPCHERLHTKPICPLSFK